MDVILNSIASLELSGPLYVLTLSLSVFMGAFLYWRAGRHELYESRFLLDLAFFSVLGGLVFGRLLAFFVEYESFNFSAYKLIFFHRYAGFNNWGFLAGILIFAFLFLKKRKESLWNIFDFTTQAIVFSSFLYYFFNFLISSFITHKQSFPNIIATIFFFILFLTLKRLGVKKRRDGYFSRLYFVAIGVFYSTLFLFENWQAILRGEKIIFLVLPVSAAIFGATLRYFQSIRNLKNDLKGFLAFILLNLFKFKRVVVSADEAGRIAKSLLLLPYFIFKSILVLLRLLSKELARAFLEFLYILGLRKY